MHRFDKLSSAEQHEVAAFFSDPGVLLGLLSPQEIASKYPGARITDSYSGEVRPRDPSKPNGPNGAVVHPMTTWSVHWWWNHDASFFGFTNTARLDNYYTKNDDAVTSENACEWTDHGPADWTIVSVDESKWVSGGHGFCYATVQLVTSTGPVNDYGSLEQDMRVRAQDPPIYWKYFHQDS